jgi:hypothetical protein
MFANVLIKLSMDSTVFAKIERICYLCPVIGCSIFLLFTTIAMFFYTGGIMHNPTTVGYTFTENFFSDLGMWTAFNGQPNTISYLLFTLGASIAGIGLIPFFIMIPITISSPKRNNWCLKVARIFAIPSAIAYTGIGLVSFDINETAHMVFVSIAFLGTFPVAILMFIGFYHITNLSNKLSFYFLIFSFCMLAYLLLIALGPPMFSIEGIKNQVIGQKIVIYAEMILMIIEGLGVLNFVQKEKNK